MIFKKKEMEKSKEEKKLIKKISIILSIVIIACLFTGCNSSKKVVNFLNYGENIDDETLKEFQDKYDIKVNVDTFDDMETMYNKIKTGAANYDVILVRAGLGTDVLFSIRP